MLKTFATHVASIVKACDGAVHLIAGDVRVTLCELDCDLERGMEQIHAIEFRGRGGTEFKPLLDKSEAIQADVALYLTDGYAAFPDPPRIPVIWAVPQGCLAPERFPWGIPVVLD